jgi:hypothetical protein
MLSLFLVFPPKTLYTLFPPTDHQLVFRKMQIKTTLRFHRIPIRNSADAVGDVQKGALLHCWWNYKLVQPLWKSIWQFHGNLEIVLLEDPAILLT